jgi:hypothetical protein
MQTAGGKRTSALTVFFLGLATFFALDRANFAQSEVLLEPDLAFILVCAHTARSDVEAKTELFLRGHGFRVLNLADIQRQHNVHLLDTSMEGAKQDQATIHIISVPSAGSRYAFTLHSRPPTSHLNDFEDAILNFVSKELECEARQVQRHDNGKERQQYFDADLKRIENLFEEADRINGERRI